MLSLFLSLLPYLCLTGTVLVCWLRPQEQSRALFDDIIDGSLIWSLALWSQTYALSLFHRLNGFYVPLFWSLYALALVCLIFRRRQWLRLPRIRGLYRWCIAGICLAALVVALAYPNSMWDVLAYHLPRAMHWLQNGTVAPFPTAIPRQIGMPPFNAMISLQSLAADAGDYFVNLGQWLAFAGMIAGAMRITAQLGGSRRAQALAGIFLATLPTAITQASNAESSDLVTFWLLAFASLFLDWQKNRSMPLALKMGCCLGLAILSKGSAYVIALPFVLAMAYACIRRYRQLLRQGLWAGCIVIAINLPFLAANYVAEGSIFYGAEKNILEKPTPQSFVMNAIYNFLLHEPWLLHGSLPKVWQELGQAIGAGEEEREIYKFGGLEQTIKELRINDDEANIQNVPHALFLLAILLAVVFGGFRPPRFYSLLAGASFAMFFLLLTWHPWAGRIHTSLFALAAPLAGLYLDSWKLTIPRGCLVLLLLVWTCFVFAWFRRPLNVQDYEEQNFLYNARDELYFNNYKPYEKPYLDAVKYLAGQNPRKVGIKIYDMAFEYPLWILARKYAKEKIEFRHVRNEEDLRKFQPDFVFVLDKGNEVYPLAMPRILKNTGSGYMQVYPEAP